MYNRYVPQQDGTYQKSRVPSPPPPVPKPESAAPPAHDVYKPVQKKPDGAFTFLQQLLPKNLDTADLLIVLLLLLMAGDNSDYKNSWMLTLALYLFL